MSRNCSLRLVLSLERTENPRARSFAFRAIVVTDDEDPCSFSASAQLGQPLGALLRGGGLLGSWFFAVGVLGAKDRRRHGRGRRQTGANHCRQRQGVVPEIVEENHES